jgi:poly(3-hydroxybutyrate) depolymerase
MRLPRTLLPTLAIGPFLLGHSVARAYDGTGTIVSQGVTRTFEYHAPGASVADGLPLVIVYHGSGGSGASIRATTGFDAVADAHGFVVAYPNSTTIGGDIQWNVYADDAPGHGGVGDDNATDDVVFTDDLIDWFCANHHTDPARIYATGLSNGGFMTYLLSIERPGRIAAFAPASGSLWGDSDHLDAAFGEDYVPVPILHIHGDPDPVVDYPDAVHDPAQWTWPLSTYGWANCGNAEYTSVNIAPNVDRLTWCDDGAPGGADVSLVRVQGLGHAWANVAGYNASEEIWLFFSDHVLASPAFTCSVGIDGPVCQEAIKVFPVPAANALHFSRPLAAGTSVKIMDGLGRSVHSGRMFNGTELPVADLDAGTYHIVIDEPSRSRVVLSFVK